MRVTKRQDLLPAPKFGAAFFNLLGREGVRCQRGRGQGRQAVSHHSALPPQSLQCSNAQFSSRLSPSALRRVALTYNRAGAAAAALLRAPQTRAALLLGPRARRGSCLPGLSLRATILTLPADPAACFQGDLLKQSPGPAPGPLSLPKNVKDLIITVWRGSS